MFDAGLNGTAGFQPARRPKAGINTGQIAAVPAACRQDAGGPDAARRDRLLRSGSILRCRPGARPAAGDARLGAAGRRRQIAADRRADPARPGRRRTGVDRPAGRRVAHADGEPEGHAADVRLRLCPAGRLHAVAGAGRRTSSKTSRSRTSAASRCICAHGHKWSDGQPFTAEDFRYWFEDVARKRDAVAGRAAGGAARRTARSRASRSSIRQTVRYSWSRPNPLFLPALAGPDPLFIYRPGPLPEAVPREIRRQGRSWTALVKQTGVRNWAQSAAQNGLDVPQRQPGPAVARALDFEDAAAGRAHRLRAQPVLLPGRRRRPSAALYRPGRADDRQQQDHPGQDRRRRERPAGALSELRRLHLPQGRASSRTATRCGCGAPGRAASWRSIPNLNVNDEVWRPLLRDVRFRRALSLAIDRHEINQAIYFGLAIEGQNTVLPQSPLYRPQYRTAAAQYDLAEANRLLDEVGLKRGSDGLRQPARRPDRRHRGRELRANRARNPTCSS